MVEFNNKIPKDAIPFVNPADISGEPFNAGSAGNLAQDIQVFGPDGKAVKQNLQVLPPEDPKSKPIFAKDKPADSTPPSTIPASTPPSNTPPASTAPASTTPANTTPASTAPESATPQAPASKHVPFLKRVANFFGLGEAYDKYYDGSLLQAGVTGFFAVTSPAVTAVVDTAEGIGEYATKSKEDKRTLLDCVGDAFSDTFHTIGRGIKKFFHFFSGRKD